MELGGKRIRPRDSVNINIKLLNIFGLWFPEEDAWSWRSKAYLLYAILFQGFFFHMYVLSETAEMINSFGNIEKMTEASFLLLTHYAQIFKITQFYRYQMKMVRFLNELENDVFTPKNAVQREILKRGMRRAVQDSQILLNAGWITCFLWAIFPFIESKDGDYIRLPLSGWYPYDARTGLNFYLTFLYQIFGVTINAMTNISLDTTATGIFIHICGQLDMLKNSLENMKETALVALYAKKQFDKKGPIVSGSFEENTIEYTEEELEAEMQSAFVNCIKHHYAILSYAKEIENIFNMCFLAQFFAGVIIVCLTMFVATLVDSFISLRFVSIILYQFCIVFELLLYSWHGNEMILKSLELAGSAYKSEWYDFSARFSRNIILIMARSKRPIEVTAGKFFALSLGTFTSVLRLSWSYFAVLRSVHDE